MSHGFLGQLISAPWGTTLKGHSSSRVPRGAKVLLSFAHSGLGLSLFFDDFVMNSHPLCLHISSSPILLQGTIGLLSLKKGTLSLASWVCLF